LLAAGRFDEVIARFPGMLSPAGLPLGPVAAYRKLNAAPDTGAALDAARQLHELAFAYPSLLTPQLLAAADDDLQRLGVTDPAATPWRDRWATLEGLAGALNRLLDQPLPPAEAHGEPMSGGEPLSHCPLMGMGDQISPLLGPSRSPHSRSGGIRSAEAHGTTPFSPASGPPMSFLNGLHPKSKFI
jgi:hypothetical protein